MHPQDRGGGTQLRKNRPPLGRRPGARPSAGPGSCSSTEGRREARPRHPTEFSRCGAAYRAGFPFSRMPDGQSSSRSEEHTSELQSPCNLVCRLLLEKKKKKLNRNYASNQAISTRTV